MSSDKHLKRLITHYRKSLLISPHSEAIHYQLAKFYYEYRDLAKALEKCQEALSIWPESTLFFEVATKIFLDLGFNKNEEIEKLLYILLNSRLDEAFFTSLDIAESLSKPSIVLSFLKEFHLPSSNSINVNENTWKSIRNSLIQAVNKENFSSALSLCDKIICFEPSLPFAHFITQYELLPKSGRIDSLLEIYLRVTELPKIHLVAHKVLGDILAEKNQFSAAIKAYRKAWEQLSDQPFDQTEGKRKRAYIDYLVIGVGKGGTSSLYHYLSQHPNIINSFTKEIGFFSEKFHYGFDWYIAQFPPLSFRPDKFVTGETYPWYLGQLDTAERVFSLMPNIKLIVTLRNPVSRAISHFYMASKLGKERRSLDQAIKDELAILEGVADPAEVAQTYWETERGYIWFSLYLPFLKQWMSVFPKEQFLILKSEELYRSPAKSLNQVFRFLDLAEFELVSYPKINQGSYSYLKVSTQSRKALYDFFYAHNQRLEEYLSMNMSWNDEL